jgi:hypothetical protein
MLRRSRPLLVAVVVVASSLIACSLPYYIWLLPFSTARHVMFGLATERDGSEVRPITRVEVGSCRKITADLREVPADTFWLAQGWDVEQSAVHRLTYGQAPPGLRDKRAARKLEPGCYRVSVSVQPGSGGVTFWVTADGKVRESTRAENDSMGALMGRRIRAEIADADRAIEKCKAEYAAARTAADSSRVDKTVWTDKARFGSYDCDFFVQYYWSRFD